jgi:hypothetical protein
MLMPLGRRYREVAALLLVPPQFIEARIPIAPHHYDLRVRWYLGWFPLKVVTTKT